jgi:DNA-binding NarL/FixJ family response regulator
MEDKSMIKVFVLDEHPVFREVLASILEKYTDFRVVGDATNIPEALTKIEELQPDIVILGILVPGTESTEATTLLQRKYPQVKVLQV